MLGMIGLGAAAGPAVVSQAVSASPVPWEQSTVQTHGIGYSIAKETYDNAWNPVEALASAKREYDRMNGDPSMWIADYVAREWDEYMNGYSIIRLETIDSDIRNMKSFSESAKMRMYLERKAKRKLESNKKHVWSRVQELMKEI
jgi:hypothetical protein